MIPVASSVIPISNKAWVDGFRWGEQWDVVQPDSLTAYDWS